MLGLDEWIVKLGGSGMMALLVAILLGLRHATDPDHLTAVSTLVLADRRHGRRRATVLGLAWGLGHAATLFGFGLPVANFYRNGTLIAQARASSGTSTSLTVVWSRPAKYSSMLT